MSAGPLSAGAAGGVHRSGRGGRGGHQLRSGCAGVRSRPGPGAAGDGQAGHRLPPRCAPDRAAPAQRRPSGPAYAGAGSRGLRGAGSAVRALNEWESKLLLGDVPKPREALTRTLNEALAFSASVTGPVVAKALGLAHKSERGAVVLNADLSACWQRLAALGDGSVLVAEQVRGELELIAGGLRDAQFGPVLTIGLGGVTAEVFRDVAFLLSPAEPGELEKATARLLSAPLFRGWRGRPPVNLGALGSILAAIGALLEADPEVSEVDVNPILVRDGQPLVLDALVVKD
ncbi:MAG: hypothetical protein DLM66_06025 [Candidatus Dormiibacter spiritus]|nr:MAG: hypothetical protein DLM66_06025 [Candidatus Dormibacteraeota bacterium]